MFRSRLHPSPFGFFLGIAVIAFWFALWVWFLAEVAIGPREATHRFPELAAVHQPVVRAGRS